MAQMGKEVHVVMLPWSAFGHLLPFFQLSISLAKSGIHVSFISTPKNIQRLPPIPSNLQSLFQFVHFPLPILQDEPLPEGAEATVDLPGPKIDYLKIAYDLLQHPLNKFLAEQKPNWIIADVIPHWIPEIAQQNQVQFLLFSVFSASSFLFLAYPESLVVGTENQKKLRPSWESMTSKPEWIDFPSSLAYTKKEAIDVFQWIYSMNASGISDGERVFKVLNSCQALIFRSCTEIEGEYLKTWEKVLGKPVIPAGLLPPEKPKLSTDEIKEDDDSWSQVFKWLDQQNPKSVVFVGFGSEFKLSKDQVFEIAYGLELSGLPFLWALRKPNWAKDDLDSLPQGFSDRTCGKGIVRFGWAPQMEILGHLSIGGTLFHSGWGSIIEMLQFGHCLVLLPFIIDQPLNARFLVEKGLGVEVERNEEDGSFSRDGISKALRLAMVSDEGKMLRARASEVAEIFGDQKLHQDYYIARLVQFLKTTE
ncbi:putative UDP-rhamnose:rhamnosyltransferase 1 [Euphorbia lathyris]|uniref:putative UDP-rhamnose:rhamnosyltransferase 1 n=1 Tax=Euphorbia lathyris TaxID=212925 RepID=UPI0033133AE3